MIFSLRNLEGPTMERKKILIIGMLDSIHLARWLKQFKNKPVDFFLMPSKKFRKIHPELKKLLIGNENAEFYLVKPFIGLEIVGYIDFLISKIGTFFGRNHRVVILKQLLSKQRFDFVHALEIQGAGYLYSEMPDLVRSKNQLILTNWGSDIYFFGNDVTHNKKISKVISQAAFYSAECVRDYKLLDNYTFSGVKLPCIPNGGGFNGAELDSFRSITSSRTTILCKGYGGLFGRANLAIPGIKSALDKFSNISAYFYSVTPDLEESIIELRRKYKDRVKYTTVSNPISREKLLSLFGTARVYIGCSKSDAISTSFLEALVYGAYPIQTNTSCVDEWISKGAHATLVKLDIDEIAMAIAKSLVDDDLVDNAQTFNLIVAKKYCHEDNIQKEAFKFYGL